MHPTVNENKAIVGCTDLYESHCGFRWLHFAPNQTGAMRYPFIFRSVSESCLLLYGVSIVYSSPCTAYGVCSIYSSTSRSSPCTAYGVCSVYSSTSSSSPCTAYGVSSVSTVFVPKSTECYWDVNLILRILSTRQPAVRHRVSPMG